MSDIIQLLPDSVANQIAAGEVIQRPASVIKELMENAIDAGATDIQVITKEAGKNLIQVIDNGCGMADTDARMSFERHATSKIKQADDLFALQTMGFRGEALASIAAIAQVELKTRRADNDLGVRICISGTNVESQEPVQCAVGSQFLIKNLFFNVPARRRFLKKNSTELRHIVNEFQRVVIAHPDVSFILVHNDVTMFQLPIGNKLQRIANMMGKQLGNQLIPINTDTVTVSIRGFIGKPESVKKTLGNQFFFVNNRYMRHSYLHKAVMEAYNNILPPGTFPAYFIFLEVDPQIVDVNIHPTKTEIKFEDERTIWQILNCAIRESIGKFNLMPSIDFDTADSIDIPVSNNGNDISAPEVEVNPFFNPFEEEPNKAVNTYRGGVGSVTIPSGVHRKAATPSDWDSLYGGFEQAKNDFSSSEHTDAHYIEPEMAPVQQTILSSGFNESTASNNRFFQLKNKYILTSVKSGLMMIDQKRAHERIVYEGFVNSIKNGASLSQKILFPEELHFSTEESLMINDLIPDLLSLGLELVNGTDGVILAQSIPAGLEGTSAKELLDSILTDYRDGEVDLQKEMNEQLAISMAKRAAMPYGKALSLHEMGELFDQLFACQVPNFSPSGKAIISILDNDELDKRFL